MFKDTCTDVDACFIRLLCAGILCQKGCVLWLHGIHKCVRQQIISALGAVFRTSVPKMQADQQAIRALQRFVRAGNKIIDPRNQNHIKAYLVARETNSRPTAEIVLSIVEGAKSKHSSATKLTQEFLLVPRASVVCGSGVRSVANSST